MRGGGRQRTPVAINQIYSFTETGATGAEPRRGKRATPPDAPSESLQLPEASRSGRHPRQQSTESGLADNAALSGSIQLLSQLHPPSQPGRRAVTGLLPEGWGITAASHPACSFLGSPSSPSIPSVPPAAGMAARMGAGQDALPWRRQPGRRFTTARPCLRASASELGQAELRACTGWEEGEGGPGVTSPVTVTLRRGTG